MFDALVSFMKSSCDALVCVATCVIEVIVAELGVPGVKAALGAVGLKGGPLRSPLMALGPTERAEVAGMIQAAALVSS